MPRPKRVPHSPEAPRKGVYDPLDLVDLGFARKSQIYQLLNIKMIPSFKIGDSDKIPGAWVHERMGLNDNK